MKLAFKTTPISGGKILFEVAWLTMNALFPPIKISNVKRRGIEITTDRQRSDENDALLYQEEVDPGRVDSLIDEICMEMKYYIKKRPEGYEEREI